jgi:OmpA-OmpF porin, OOP family
MNETFCIRALTILFTAMLGMTAFSENNKECKDHPSFSSLPGYTLEKCIIKDSASYIFPLGNDFPGKEKERTVTGHYSSYFYKSMGTTESRPSLLIFRDLEDSLRYAYGVVLGRKIELGDTSNFVTGKISRDNFQTWVCIKATGPDYRLTFVDKPYKVRLMNASEMYDELSKRDTATLDIFFKDDTSTVIPASMPLVEHLYEMLKAHPDLHISIQCHSDNQGNATGKKILTANRAKEVLDMMTSRGIDKKRLTSCGWGGDHPVGDNKTEEGRAKNRRIVIVKM